MALNNAGRTMCVYTGKRPVEVNNSCIYYGDETNRSFINSQSFQYFNTNGLATSNVVMFTYETAPDLFSTATDEEVKSYIENKLKSINSASVKYYDYNNEALPVVRSFSINKTQLTQAINNPSKVIEFDRSETLIDYAIQVSETKAIGCSVMNELTLSGTVVKTLEFFITSSENLSGVKEIEIREMCRDLSDDETPYITSDYITLLDISEAPQEFAWRNVQLVYDATRTITTRQIYGYENEEVIP